MERKKGYQSLKGVFLPIITPFDATGETVNYKELRKNIERWNQTGLVGYVVLGSTGENVYLDKQEKLNVVKAVSQTAATDKFIIAGSGCESLRATLDLTNKLGDMGASAALVITPFYYRTQMDEIALISYYTTLADKSTIPIVIYSVPKFTGIDIDSGIVSELAQHPNIVGIKDSSGNVAKIGIYVNTTPADFNILVGTASAFYAALMLGAVGGVLALANIAPRECVEIYDAVQVGKYKDAKNIQLRVLPVNNAVTTEFGIPGLKAAMDMLGYYGGPPRSPLLPVEEPVLRELRKILDKADLL